MPDVQANAEKVGVSGEKAVEANQPMEAENHVVSEGTSLLYLACRKGCYDLCLALLMVGANVEDRGEDEGLTPLMEASRSGHLSLVQMLIDKRGAHVNARSRAGMTPLMYACANGHVSVAQCLLSRGATADMSTVHSATQAE